MKWSGDKASRQGYAVCQGCHKQDTHAQAVVSLCVSLVTPKTPHTLQPSPQSQRPSQPASPPVEPRMQQWPLQSSDQKRR
jgi:hypothetical protein